MTTFTEQQLADWRVYERVRKSGKWNMYGERARIAIGLGEAAYMFVMEHYTELKARVEEGVLLESVDIQPTYLTDEADD